MNQPSSSSEPAVVAAFFERYRRDLASNSVLSLAAYQALYPGYENVIAREFEQLSSAERGATASPLALNTVGAYRVIREIGRGGQGEVYLAEDTRLGRKVALKVLRRLGCASTDTIARFHREGEIAARLDHPGIATVYETGVSDGVPFIAMRYVAGESLADRIRAVRDSAGTRTESDPEGARETRRNAEPPVTGDSSAPDRGAILEIVHIIERAARALDVAHEAGVIHRDVKPGNILITEDGTPVVLDFGLARELEGDGSLTMSGELFGTPDYMSPEQLTAHRVPLDRRTDVYSLAVTLFECLTLRRPFESPTRERLYQAILGKEPPNVRKLNAAVPPDLKVVLETALEKDRDQRYRSAREFADELERVRRHRPIEARPIGSLRRFGRWIAREPARAAVLLLAIVLAGAAGYVTHAWPGISADRRLAESVRRAERIERLLETSYVDVDKGDKEEALTGFFEVLELEPESAVAVAGVAIAYEKLAQRAKSIEFLEQKRAVIERHPNLNWFLARALHAVGRTEEAEAIEEEEITTEGHVDHFLAATIWLHRGHSGKPNAFPRAVRHMRQCLLMTSRTPPLYHFTLAHALGHVDDPRSCRDVAASLKRLYPDSAEAHFWRGFALGDCDYAGAVSAFREALRLRPAFRAASFNLGRALYLEGDHAAALECLQALREADPDDPVAAFFVGRAHLVKGDAEAAAKALDTAIRLQPRYSEAHYNLGIAREDCGDPDGALASYREALAIRPYFPSALFNIAAIHQRAGDLEEALASFRRVLRQAPRHADAHFFIGELLREKGDLDGALRAFGQVLSLEPENAKALMKIGSLLHRKKEYEAAKRVFQRSVEKWPELSQAHDGLGSTYLELREFDAAVRAHERAVELNPERAEQWYNLGRAYHKAKQFDRALEAYGKAYELDSSVPEISYEIGNVHMAQRAYDRALPHYRRAVRLRPAYPTAKVNLAQCLDYNGQRRAALGLLEQTVRDAPGVFKAWYSLGIVRARNGDLRGAITAYRETVRLAPRYVQAHTNLGIMLRRDGKIERAIESFDQALRIEPNFPPALHGLERALREDGRPEEALAINDQALRRNPRDPFPTYGRARCLEMLHRYREARDLFERAHRLGRKTKGWPRPTVDRVRAIERRAALEEMLESLVIAEFEPADAEEHAALARMATDKQRYALAVELWDDLLAEAQPLRTLLKGAYRHHAARAAFLAAIGRGLDAFSIDVVERARLRMRAIAWLEADLAAWRELREAGQLQQSSLLRLLERWKASDTLAPLRDAASLAALPDEDRKRYEAFWDSVDALMETQ